MPRVQQAHCRYQYAEKLQIVAIEVIE